MTEHLERLLTMKHTIESELMWLEFILRIYNEAPQEDEPEIIKEIRAKIKTDDEEKP